MCFNFKKYIFTYKTKERKFFNRNILEPYPLAMHARRIMVVRYPIYLFTNRPIIYWDYTRLLNYSLNAKLHFCAYYQHNFSHPANLL